MRQILSVCVGLGAIILSARATGGDEKSEELAAVKEVLLATIKHVEPKIKGHEKAEAELKKFRDVNDAQLAKMAIELKAKFKVESLNPANRKKIEAEIKKAIESITADELRKAVATGDAKYLPKDVRPQLCWLPPWNCD
jgi:hypothetical protein